MYVCVYVHEYAGVQGPEEGVKSSRAGVTGGCKPLTWVLGTTGSLQEE